MRTIRRHVSGATRKSVVAWLLSLGVGGALAGLVEGASADSVLSTRETFAARARQLYEAGRAAFTRAPTNATAAWEFGRACFDWAEFATNNGQRAIIAEDGIVACRAAILLNTNLAAAPYYLGLNLGQLARVKRFSALGLVEDMRDQFEVARRLEERFDFAGPDRNLGLLYLQAPGWPISVGNRAKAREHLERAVRLSPNHPENRLNLIEARLQWRESELLSAEIEALADLMPRARKVLTGEAWAFSWTDWDRRWDAVGVQASKLTKRPRRGGGAE